MPSQKKIKKRVKQIKKQIKKTKPKRTQKQKQKQSVIQKVSINNGGGNTRQPQSVPNIQIHPQISSPPPQYYPTPPQYYPTPPPPPQYHEPVLQSIPKSIFTENEKTEKIKTNEKEKWNTSKINEKEKWNPSKINTDSENDFNIFPRYRRGEHNFSQETMLKPEKKPLSNNLFYSPRNVSPRNVSEIKPKKIKKKKSLREQQNKINFYYPSDEIFNEEISRGAEREKHRKMKKDVLDNRAMTMNELRALTSDNFTSGSDGGIIGE